MPGEDSGVQFLEVLDGTGIAQAQRLVGTDVLGLHDACGEDQGKSGKQRSQGFHEDSPRSELFDSCRLSRRT
ncbi:hypothetical protein D9M72_626420 [compost metagenome]